LKIMRNKALLALGVSFLVVTGYVATPVVAADKAKVAKVPKPFTEKEKATGAKYHPEIIKEFGEAYQSPQTAYVVKVGQKIALQSGLAASEKDFTVTFLNSPVNNAFAIDGGYVYITRQLAALCNSEAEMAGVLGHEVGHTAARHSKKRANNSRLAGILGMGGTILGAVLGDNGGLAGAIGGIARENSMMLSQRLIALPFSRGQEEEADDLGIQYLSKAGYDPSALSDMLRSLALQTAVDGKAAGHMGGAVPEWASTHPDPAKRVVRAATNAKKFPAATLRNADGHMKAIDGMLFDDDPKQGVVDGQDFIHPDLKLKFSVPTGFGMSNGAQAVSINGSGGQALFTTQAYSGDKKAYIDAAFLAVVGKDQPITASAISETTVNGIPTFTSTADVTTQNGVVRLTVYAYEFAAAQAFHFVTIAPNTTTPFTAMYQSVSRISQKEADAVKPRKLRVVTVGKSDSVASLSGRMAYKNYQSDRFLALNGMTSTSTLKLGQKVKIVTY
jgi:predicted Zn-dependent protease